MFCTKCGAQNTEGASFCNKCGALFLPTETLKQPKGDTNVPLFFERIVDFFKAIPKKKNYAVSVADAANDDSFSGIIPLIMAIIFSALTSMVNLNQMLSKVLKSAFGEIGDFFDSENEFVNEAIKQFGTYKLFLLSLLFNTLIAAAVVIGVYFFVKKAYKNVVTFSGAVGIVGYAALPIFLVSLVNLIVGLIWIPIAILLEVLAIVVFIATVVNALEYAYGTGEIAFNKIIILILGIVFVFFTFVGLSYACYFKGSFSSLIGSLSTSLF